MLAKRLMGAGGLVILVACSRAPHREKAAPSSSQPSALPAASTAKKSAPTSLVTPTRLVSMPVSAYSTSLALDGDDVYLFTSNAAYRLVEGQPAQGIQLDLGIGPVLTDSGIVFWSKGFIWLAPKEGGTVRTLAKLPHQPQYFVASSAGLAWVDHTDEGVYSIQSLDGRKARILVTSKGELSALHMIRDSVFFVQRAEDNSWQIGRVRVTGGETEYTKSKTGASPALLTGAENPIYFERDKTEIQELMPSLKSERTWLKDFVCTPLFAMKNVYCACVEGLFEVHGESHKPKVLVSGRREPIAFIRANAKRVVFTVDTGADQLAVDSLPIE
jgi:hypothetical protein